MCVMKPMAETTGGRYLLIICFLLGYSVLHVQPHISWHNFFLTFLTSEGETNTHIYLVCCLLKLWTLSELYAMGQGKFGWTSRCIILELARVRRKHTSSL